MEKITGFGLGFFEAIGMVFKKLIPGRGFFG
jgi:hypothetical protein